MHSIPPQLLKTSAMVICRLLPVLALTDHEGMIDTEHPTVGGDISTSSFFEAERRISNLPPSTSG